VIEPPFALFITWTTYGTWLPGDRRGYVSNTLRSEGVERKRNQPGTEYAADHEFTRRRAGEIQKYPPVRLSRSHALAAASALADTSRDRGWQVMRGAVMANHVHLLLRDVPDDGPAVRRILKGVSQKVLSDRHGKPMRWWTAGGSDRYLHDERSTLGAVAYVEQQEWMLARIVGGIASECEPAHEGGGPPG